MKLTKTQQIQKRMDHVISLLRKQDINVYIWDDMGKPKRPESEIVFSYRQKDRIETIYKTMPLNQAFYFLLQMHERLTSISEAGL